MLITTVSFLNWTFGARERRVVRNRACFIRNAPDPVFILGHWGSGTTWLHSLLTQDKMMACCTLFDVANPHTMLTSEAFQRRCFERFTPARRVWDNVAVSLDMPAEDEFAVSILAPMSPYLAWCFPKREQHYDRFLTFDDASPAEIEAWRSALASWVRKLQIKYDGRQLVLKSPPHTARIRLLLELFPRARFVHLHRNPCDVFQATRRVYAKALPYFYLQQARDDIEVDEGILHRFEMMYNAYFAQHHLIPAGRFFSISYEDLVENPVREIASIYRSLELPGFADARDPLCEYLTSIENYQTNQNPPLPSYLRRAIQQHCGHYLRKWPYVVDA